MPPSLAACPICTPRQLLLYGLAALAFLVLAAWYLGRGDGAAAAPAGGGARCAVQGDGGRRGGPALIVDVAGAVRRPGVYRLPAGSRVEDALRRAGGARPRADLSAINRAAELEDGRQVLVPRRARVATAGGVAPAAARPAAARRGRAAEPQHRDARAARRAGRHRPGHRAADPRLPTEHGGFGSVEELDQVPGIGETRMAALREKVRV